MRFLIDNAISPVVVQSLREAGHDAVHIRELGLQHAKDADILARAASEDRVLISADTDFGILLALRPRTKPSFILFRGAVERRPEKQAQVLLENLPTLQPYLERGAIVTIRHPHLRIRELPI